MPVRGLRKARKGLALRVELLSGHVPGGVDVGISVVVAALGSDGEVVGATSIVDGSLGGVCCELMASCGGGKRLKNARSRGWRVCARRIFCSIAALVVDEKGSKG